MEEEVKKDEVIEEALPEGTKDNDQSLENEALKELIQEMKATNSQLINELNEVKKTNAKLLASIDTTPNEVPVEETINSLFNKYNKR